MTARARGATVAVTVRDTGAGIAAGNLDRIFEPFVQAERTRDVAHGGLGLGLPLVRELAKLHGGTVRGSSGGVGHGAEFVIELPLAQGALNASAVDGAAATPNPARQRARSRVSSRWARKQPQTPRACGRRRPRGGGGRPLRARRRRGGRRRDAAGAAQAVGHAPRVSSRGQAAMVDAAESPPTCSFATSACPT